MQVLINLFILLSISGWPSSAAGLFQLKMTGSIILTVLCIVNFYLHWCRQILGIFKSLSEYMQLHILTPLTPRKSNFWTKDFRKSFIEQTLNPLAHQLIFCFFHANMSTFLHFSSSFSNFLKILKVLNSSPLNYLFNEVLLLIISFYLQEELTKMCGLPELLE